MRSVAFFDLDLTLLSINSAKLWVQREWEHGFVSKRQVLQALVGLVFYKLGMSHTENLVLDAIRALRGQKERDIIDRTLAFWDDDVRELIRPKAHAVVEMHRQRGDYLFLLTSSSNYLSAPAADLLRFDGFLANRFAVRDGVFTGEPDGPLCYGAGKRVHAAALCERLGVSLSTCTFYTDSITDLPMLEAVGHPVAVHPDGRLLRLAKERGWPVEDWGAILPKKTITGARSVVDAVAAAKQARRQRAMMRGQELRAQAQQTQNDKHGTT